MMSHKFWLNISNKLVQQIKEINLRWCDHYRWKNAKGCIFNLWFCNLIVRRVSLWPCCLSNPVHPQTLQKSTVLWKISISISKSAWFFIYGGWMRLWALGVNVMFDFVEIHRAGLMMMLILGFGEHFDALPSSFVVFWLFNILPILFNFNSVGRSANRSLVLTLRSWVVLESRVRLLFRFSFLG